VHRSKVLDVFQGREFEESVAAPVVAGGGFEAERVLQVGTEGRFRSLARGRYAHQECVTALPRQVGVVDPRMVLVVVDGSGTGLVGVVGIVGDSPVKLVVDLVHERVVAFLALDRGGGVPGGGGILGQHRCLVFVVESPGDGGGVRRDGRQHQAAERRFQGTGHLFLQRCVFVLFCFVSCG